jgi:protein-disulfide isomerase
MSEEEIIEKKHKKWHQKWWGITILFVFSVLILYVGAFIYELVSLVEAQNQLLVDSMNQQDLQQNVSISTRDFVEIPNAAYFGPANANIVIVEFSDFQCPFCKEAYPILKNIRQEYATTVKIIYRDFPNLLNHPDALNAAMAANCANEQGKFAAYHDLLFENQSDLTLENLKSLAQIVGLETIKFNQCLDAKKYLGKVQIDLQDGAKLGIQGTPTFFINGISVEGVIAYDQFKLAIESLEQAEEANIKMQNLNNQ